MHWFNHILPLHALFATYGIPNVAWILKQKNNNNKYNASRIWNNVLEEHNSLHSMKY